MRRHVGWLLVAAVTWPGSAAIVAHGSQLQQAPSTAATDELIDASFRAAYSLDYANATDLARRALASAPDSSRAHRTLGVVLWLDILFRRGAVTVDHYLGGVGKTLKSVPEPPPDLLAEFEHETRRAIELAEQAVEAQPADANARYDLGAAHALQASYAASVEGSLAAAFSAARHAFDAQQQVLEADPGRTGAQLVVGTYRYVISTLSVPTRMFAYIVGFRGDRERGIAMIEGAAADPHLMVETGTTLLLVYAREGRHADALAVAERLSAAFPRNRFFLLEVGAAALRAGRPAEAEAVFSRGLAAAAVDDRPKAPGEEALWFYKRGIARAALGQIDAARADLLSALGSRPAGWIEGRIHIELGRLAERSGERAAARLAYGQARQVCDRYDDRACVREAGQRLSQAASSR